MKLIKNVSELQMGNVLLVVYYNLYSYASGDAEGWVSYTCSVIRVDGSGAILGPPEVNEESIHEWSGKHPGENILLNTPPKMMLGPSGYELEVIVFMLQSKRMGDIDEEDDDGTSALIDEQVVSLEV